MKQLFRVRRCGDGAGLGCSVVMRGSSVMVAKSFVMVVLATLLGPAVGVGIFVLLHTL